MSSIKSISAFFGLVFIAACARELDVQAPSGELQEIRISASAPDGKTSLDNLTLSWTEGDQVAAFDGSFVRTLAAEKSGVSSDLIGEALPSATYPLLYPRSGVSGYKDGAFQASIPSTQSAAPGGVDPKATLLFGIAENGSAAMLNVCGYLRFEISATDICSIRISALGGEKFCGNGSVSSAATGGFDSSSVQLIPASGESFALGTYTVGLAPVVMAGGIEVRLVHTNRSIGIKSNNSPLTIEAGKVTSLVNPIDSGTYTSYASSTDLTPEVIAIHQSHPYLFSDAKDFERHKNAVLHANTKALLLMHNELIAAAGRIVSFNKRLTYMYDSGSTTSMLGLSRDAFGRIFYCAYAYRFTGEKKYLDMAETMLNQISNFPNWNKGGHYLDTATFLEAAAIGYDWLYDDLSAETKEAVETAAFKNCLTGCRTDASSYIKYTNAWNQTVTAALIMGASAFYRCNPELCTQILQDVIPSHYEGVRFKYGVDGSYPSGTNYWRNNVEMVMIGVSTLRSVYGTDFGISDFGGFWKTGEWYLHMCGNTNQNFVFGDNFNKMPLVPSMFFFAALTGNPDCAWFEVQAAEHGEVLSGGALNQTANIEDRVYPLSVVWASKLNDITPATPKNGVYAAIEDRQPIVTCRTGWGPNDIYMAIKGGQADTDHGHMDAGSICFDAYGHRWCADITQDSYGTMESAAAAKGYSIWDSGAGSIRWKLFAISPRQHTTFTVNGYNYDPAAAAKFTSVIDEPGRMGAVLDMSPLFGTHLASATRTAEVIDGASLRITDKIITSTTRAITRWNFCTDAKATVESDHILLKAGDVTMTLKVKIKEKSDLAVTYEMFTNDPTKVETPSPIASSEKVRDEYDFCGFTIKIPAYTTAEIVTEITKN